GVLFISAFIYRYLGGDVHQPLLVIFLTAGFSALAVLFTWVIAKRLWDEKTARWAAIGVAIYPEAVMLGSVQMREAFLITLVVFAIMLLMRFWKSPSWKQPLGLVGTLFVSAAISIPFAIMLLFTLTVLSLRLGRAHIFVGKRGKVVVIGLIGVALVTAFALDQSTHWIQQIIKWQTYSSVRISGRLALMFEKIPKWSQLPFLMGYGVVRPLLPSAVFDGTILLWRVVAIWRALGWTVMLVLLLYASFLVIKDRLWGETTTLLLGVNWIVIIIAAFRGGGDLWDNPRYRATFAGLQVALAAWAIMRHKATNDPWLRRGVGMVVMMLAWFGPWYVQRKFFDLHWQIWELADLIGLGLASGFLYLIWDWMRERDKYLFPSN
ncbi:MAG: glycosyltransferase family 39 protein, partial [Chloroflexota bacterium]